MIFRSIFFSIALAVSGNALAKNEQTFKSLDKITIQDLNGKDIISLRVSDLKKDFPQYFIETRTPIITQKRVFKGPLIEDMLAKAGISQYPSVRIVAYDGYTSIITLDDIRAHKPIMAIESLKPGEKCFNNRCEDDTRFRRLDPALQR